jgi:hypothetical protein
VQQSEEGARDDDSRSQAIPLAQAIEGITAVQALLDEGRQDLFAGQLRGEEDLDQSVDTDVLRGQRGEEPGPLRRPG